MRTLISKLRTSFSDFRVAASPLLCLPPVPMRRRLHQNESWPGRTSEIKQACGDLYTLPTISGMETYLDHLPDEVHGRRDPFREVGESWGDRILEAEAMENNLDRVPFRVRQVIDDARRTIAARADSKSIGLTVNVADAVPEEVVGDPVRLLHVLKKLAENAVRFTQRGAVDMHCDLAALAQGNARLCFRVEDTGIGLSRSERALLFEFLGQRRGQFLDDSGLGLPACARLVALMGGQLEVESVPGLGTKFAFVANFGLVYG